MIFHYSLDKNFDIKNLEVAQFDATIRGGRKLVYKGYSFNINRKVCGGVSWKCTKYGTWKCLARAKTRIIDNIEYIEISQGLHTHPVDSECK